MLAHHVPVFTVISSFTKDTLRTQEFKNLSHSSTHDPACKSHKQDKTANTNRNLTQYTDKHCRLLTGRNNTSFVSHSHSDRIVFN